MSEPVPVALSPDGSWLACGDGPEVLVYRGTGRPAWKVFTEGVVVAVGCTADRLVAADSDGRVGWFRLIDGRPEDSSRGSPITAAAVSPTGFTAALLASGGVEVAVPGRAHQGLPAAAAGVLAFGPAGESLGFGGRDGRVRAADPGTGASWGEVDVGSPVHGITWRAPDQWLVSTGTALLGVASDATAVSFRIEVAAEGEPLGQVACSADGLVAACVLGDQRVAVFELHERRFLGTIDLRRPVGGVAFGGASVLAIALDDGDVSLVDVTNGASWRTEPHPGRGRNSWNLDLRVDLAAVRGARIKSRAGDAAIATYTGWRPEDERGSRGWWAGCLSCLTGCGCLVASIAAGILAMYVLRAWGAF